MRWKLHTNYNQTGGPDCVHQVAGALKKMGHYAAIVYEPLGDGQGVMPCYAERYNIDIAETRKENTDDPDTVQVLPAGWGPNWYQFSPDTPSCLKFTGENLYQSTKVMYWLGVTPWQDWALGGLDVEVDLSHPNMSKMYHGCQSQRAYDFLINSKKINPAHIFMLREHTNDVFIHDESYLKSILPNKKNIILYNPRKGYQITKQIIEFCSDLDGEFVAISEMTHERMKEVGLESKIYIDFGHFPGKDKIHREMVVCGCTIITGNEGSAANPIDVPNGSRKFPRIQGHYDLIAIKKQIRNDLANHEASFYDDHMVFYRDVVRKEKETFYKDVENMVKIVSQGPLK